MIKLVFNFSVDLALLLSSKAPDFSDLLNLLRATLAQLLIRSENLISRQMNAQGLFDMLKEHSNSRTNYDL